MHAWPPVLLFRIGRPEVDKIDTQLHRHSTPGSHLHNSRAIGYNVSYFSTEPYVDELSFCLASTVRQLLQESGATSTSASGMRQAEFCSVILLAFAYFIQGDYKKVGHQPSTEGPSHGVDGVLLSENALSHRRYLFSGAPTSRSPPPSFHSPRHLHVVPLIRQKKRKTESPASDSHLKLLGRNQRPGRSRHFCWRRRLALIPRAISDPGLVTLPGARGARWSCGAGSGETGERT